MGLDLDKRHIMKHHLVLFYGPSVKDIGRNVFHGQVNALGSGFIQDIGKQAHLKFKTQDIHPGDTLLSTLQNNLFHKQSGDGQVHRPHHHHTAGLFTMKRLEILNGLGPVGMQNELQKILFPGF